MCSIALSQKPGSTFFACLNTVVVDDYLPLYASENITISSFEGPHMTLRLSKNLIAEVEGPESKSETLCIERIDPCFQVMPR
jgi:hypothetical protein